MVVVPYDQLPDPSADKMAVPANGSFTFTNTIYGELYDVMATTEDLNIGDSQPDPRISPTGFYLSGEVGGDGNEDWGGFVLVFGFAVDC